MAESRCCWFHFWKGSRLSKAKTKLSGTETNAFPLNGRLVSQRGGDTERGMYLHLLESTRQADQFDNGQYKLVTGTLTVMGPMDCTPMIPPGSPVRTTTFYARFPKVDITNTNRP